MRCTNCGWENSGDRSNCEKCNSPLSNYAMREHAGDGCLCSAYSE